jgi:hypothetical protein
MPQCTANDPSLHYLITNGALADNQNTISIEALGYFITRVSFFILSISGSFTFTLVQRKEIAVWISGLPLLDRKKEQKLCYHVVKESGIQASSVLKR